MYFNEKEDTKLLSFKDLNASLMRIMSCPQDIHGTEKLDYKE